MKVSQIIKTLATRAGIAEGDANLTSVLEAVGDIDANDDLGKALTEKLITEAEAENRPTIKSKFTAQVYNGIDALIHKDLAEFLSADEIEALKKEEKSTMKTLSRIMAKAKELKASGKPGDRADANKLQEQYNAEIEKLKAQLAEKEQKFEEEKKTLESSYNEKMYYTELGLQVVGRNDVNDFAKAKKGKRVIDDFKETLEKLGGVLDISTGKIMQAADPKLELYIDSKKATPELVLEKTLAENDYIKKSDPAPQARTITTGDPQAQATQMSEAQRKNLERLKAQ